MKIFLSTVLFLSLFVAASARPLSYLPYDTNRLTLEADLIVIAAPVTVRETKEKTTIPFIASHDIDGYHPVPAIGVETTFKVLSVSKGDTTLKRFVLHHLRIVKESDSEITYEQPLLVSFNPKEKIKYLMFLKKESDGRYAAVSGQTDPLLAILGLYSPLLARKGHAGFITNFGEFTISNSPWSVRTFETNQASYILCSYTYGSGNNALGKPQMVFSFDHDLGVGWFVFAENSERVWAFDGGTNCMLAVAHLPSQLGPFFETYSSPPFPCSVPDEMQKRLPPEARDAIANAKSSRFPF